MRIHRGSPVRIKAEEASPSVWIIAKDDHLRLRWQAFMTPNVISSQEFVIAKRMRSQSPLSTPAALPP
jgi:hypothetical protein